MTRGQKGCYIYCTDVETNLFFKSLMVPEETSTINAAERYPNLPLRVVPSWEAKPYENCIPIYDLSIAAGLFSDEQAIVDDQDWVEMPPEFRIQEGLFVTRVIGESMNRRIPNGSWCLFRAKPAGTREGKIVLVQHREINDIDLGGHYTIKLYHSEKVASEDFEWQHRRIILKPDTTSPGYAPIVIDSADLEEFQLIAEFVAVL